MSKPVNIRIDRLMKAVQLSAKDCLRAIKDALEAMDKEYHPNWDARTSGSGYGFDSARRLP